MDTELRKRLKEAALNISRVCPPHGQFGTGDYEPAEFDEDMYKAAIAGAEYGYKEAIAQAIRWWKEEIFEHYDETCELIVKHITKEELFKGFEKEMLELLEETK